MRLGHQLLHGDRAWLGLAAYLIQGFMHGRCHQSEPSIQKPRHQLPQLLHCRRCIRPLCKSCEISRPRWLLPVYDVRNPIATSVLLTIIRRLSSMSHVIHLAILHLPSTILQHPYVIAPIENAERLVDVIKSTLDPVRPGDTGKTWISKCDQSQRK